MQTIYLVVEHDVYHNESTPLKAFYHQGNAEAYKQQVEHSLRKALVKRGIDVRIKKIDLV